MDDSTTEKPPLSLAKKEAAFLQTLITKGEIVNLYLLSGIKLQGYLLGFDKYTLLLKAAAPNSLNAPNNQLLIYKHAVSTLSVGNYNANTNTRPRSVYPLQSNAAVN